MGRKSLADERREQILAAFERCVTRHGLEGSTIDLIAQEAKVRPSIIRHYIGNWDDLVKALMDRVIASYREMIDKNFRTLPDTTRFKTSLDTLFSDQMHHPAQVRMVMGILMTTKDQYPDAKRRLVDFLDEMVDEFAEVLLRSYPRASKEGCRQVSYAIICLSLANDSFSAMGVSKQHLEYARNSALELCKDLENA